MLIMPFYKELVSLKLISTKIVFLCSKLKVLLTFINFYVKLKVSIKRNYMLYSKDLTVKFFGLESHPCSFQVMSTNEFFGFSKI